MFYLRTPHNAFMTTDIADKGLKNWVEAWFSALVLIGRRIKKIILKNVQKSTASAIQILNTTPR